MTGGIAGCGETLCNFNSHAHVERDPVTIVIHFLIKISTHTLTWSVTHKHVAFVTNCSISTHTLTWSVTNSVLDTVGLDTISTHTLTWSVTRYHVV